MDGKTFGDLSPGLARNMLDDIGDGIVVVDREEHLLYINEAGQKILSCRGNLSNEVKFRDICPLVDLATGEAFCGPLQQAMREERAIGLAKNIGIMSDKGPVYLSATCSPIHENGRVTGCSVVLRDITQLRRLEKSIEADHMYMRSVFKVAHIGLCVLNCAGEIVEVNDSALRILRTTRGIAVGLQFGDAFRCENSLMSGCGHGHECKLCPVRNNLEAAINDETYKSDFTVLMSSPDTNKPEWLQVFVSQVLLSPSERKIIVTLIDISDREERKAHIEQARLKAEHENRLKGQFLATISHEIRTPINGMIGMIDLAARESLTPEQKENLQSAKECAEDLLLIINDILDYSKIESGRLELESISFDLHSQLKQVIKVQANVAKGRNLYFKGPELSKLPRFICGDPLRLRQILNNLLANALKFTAKGGVSLEAETVTLNKQPYLELRVRDSGIGISAKEQEKLFKPFSQVDGSITRRFGGTGLGLMIVKELVEAMKGTIGVESAPGEGSLFTCRLPLIETDKAAVDDIGKNVLLNPKRAAGEKATPRPAPASGADSDIAALLKYCEDKLKEPGEEKP